MGSVSGGLQRQIPLFSQAAAFLHIQLKGLIEPMLDGDIGLQLLLGKIRQALKGTLVTGLLKLLMIAVDGVPLLSEKEIVLTVVVFVALLAYPSFFFSFRISWEEALLVLSKVLEISEAVMPGWLPIILIIWDSAWNRMTPL